MRRARVVVGLSYHQLAHVHRMKTIHILLGVDGIENLCLIEVFRQRKLHQNAMYLGVFVQLVDQRKQLLLGRFRRQVMPLRVDAQRLRRLLLLTDVDL